MTKGQRIRKRREQACISQTDFAKSIGVSKQTLYKYENDIITNIPSDVIEKMSFRLNCTPGYIMGWDKELIELRKDFHETEALFEYAKKIAELPPEQRTNVMQYIDFVSNRENKP